MATVQQILSQKAIEDVWTIKADETVYNALALMAEKNVGSLVVITDHAVAGMMTERDYTRKVILAGRSSRTTKISEVMTDNVLYVMPNDTVENCMALMTDKRVRHLPVLEDNKLVGLVSIGDVVKAMLSDQQFMIDQLTRYITDSYTDSPEEADLKWKRATA